MITAQQLAARLGVRVETIHSYQRTGRIHGRIYNDKGARMYHPDTRPESPAPSRRTTTSASTSRSTQGGAV
jgi:predicted site-specific integrase-resolvase